MTRGIAWGALALVLAASSGCGVKGDAVRGSGTIELDEVDVASLVGGRVTSLHVDEGDTVAAGEVIATLERGEVAAALEEQAAQATRARALLKDQQAGARAPEVRAARSELNAADASLALAESELKRVEALYADHVAAPADLDRARSTRDAALAARDGSAQRLALIESGSREGQLAAARAATVAADASVAAARSRTRELVLTAPSRGIVLLRNVVPGEVVNPGIPVVTLGDPERLWIRVYVATPLLPRVRLGATAEVRVSGVTRSFTGRVVEIASRAEFTPRAALTEEERANLVFGVKVALDPTAGVLKPGLPADVTIHAPPVGAP